MKYALLILPLFFFVACDDKPVGNNPDHISGDTTENNPEILAITERILEEPENPALYRDRARLMRKESRWDDALQDINRALRIDTLDDETLGLKALIYLDQANFNESYKYYQKCIDANGENTDCLLGQAEIELLLNQYGKAIELINTSLRVDEFEPRAYWLKGIYHKETGDTALARSSYATATEIDPGFTDAWIQLGLLWQDERPDLTIAYYRSALEADPTSTDALYNLGLLLQEQSQGDEAQLRESISMYQRLAEVAPIDSRPHYNQGFIQLEYFQHYDSAATHFSAAIDRFALYHQAYYNRGLCKESMDDLKGALEDYNQALAIDPGYEPAARAKGRVLGK